MTENRAAGAASESGGGLRVIAVATVVAGAVGYLIVGAVPKVVGVERGGAFAAYWSVLYFLIAGVSGLQQEVARATRPAPSPTRTPLVRFTLISALTAAGLVTLTSPLWAPSTLGASPWSEVAALAVALAGYAGVAVLSGVFYGLRLWPGVAGMTIVDAVLRLLLVAVVLLIWQTNAGVGVLAWAVALPFPLALAALWWRHRAQVTGQFTIDVSSAKLASNALHTLGGAVALGVLTSGLPALIKATSASEPPAQVGALVFVVILTRAPLVVPILALQGWLTVHFRERASEQPRPVVLLTGAVLGASVLVGAIAYVLEPWLLATIWGPDFRLDGTICAGIVIAAGLTAALCVTGPATLAADRHRAYLIGWVVAALVTVGLFFVPLPLVQRAVLAMAAGPIFGMAIHLAALLRNPARRDAADALG